MFSKFLSSIEGVADYAIFSLILFFSIMVFTIFWVVKLDKKYVNKMGNLPLEDDTESDNSIKKEFENDK